MRIARFVVGPVSTNCYIVACDVTSQAIVIDPDLRDEEEARTILDYIEREGLDAAYILNTHGHTDHTAGNRRLKQALGASILVHEEDAPLLPVPWKRLEEAGSSRRCLVCGAAGVRLDVAKNGSTSVVRCPRCGFYFDFVSSPAADRVLRDGDTVRVGHIEFLVIHTPGHSPGEICLYCEKEKIMFSGDTLFQGSIGRTDLPGSCEEDMVRSLKRLARLPDEIVVYPGHGEPTTIGDEKSPGLWLSD